MKRIPLLVWIIIAIASGVLIGSFTPGIISGVNGATGWALPTDLVVQLFVSFSTVFSAFLSFAIPLIIIGFIVPGIGSLAKGAGKLLGTTLGLAYFSSVFAGFVAITVALLIYPTILKGQRLTSFENPEESLSAGYLTFTLDPIMSVMSALILSFILGLGLTALPNKNLLGIFQDFQTIIEKLLSYVIIPLLPVHIVGVFANMTLAGEVAMILQVFGKVFIMVILLHWTMLLIQYTVSGAITKRNPITFLKNMMPAYFTALGTQSSAATIPVTVRSAKNAGVSGRIVDFAVPLCANIHLSGSMITITSCAVAVLYMTNGDLSLTSMVPVILVLGVMMVAAPGVPGGAVMTAIGLLQSMLGFDESMVALMIALYLAQDSFGTATNVTGDATIAAVTETIAKKIGAHNDDDEAAYLEETAAVKA
ncbi:MULTISPECIES: dicarboxylate/amino acid:cation symporter [unclassified Rothia (in: high G+C Gram-positive bacteria)]|uniref:dicarboxylate/amino acid:cation symporter n=1 Tax=unclassified Rothia (in: high G+C Gram-positive bacteria) TaxID=2689056 RepID=UPI00195ADCFE|nr:MULTISPECIES: dicarboxylate/amino acid:cation symporter [unclassified Rothia (in: high G+C Gram-positive bacteria)]MBM7050645.1 dicarboxylate/amino acid:cation symporter [Rothia sp. ZJ1223]QRZ60836.1 dicarboxylate/amino acid:cation symporter [Rothia sp. ZJ932]